MVSTLFKSKLFKMPYETQNTSLLNHAQQIRLLQKRIRVAEEGWHYSFDALNTLLAQIKTIDFTREGAASEFQNRVIELFPDDLADAETDTEFNSNDESGEDETDMESGEEGEESGEEGEEAGEGGEEAGEEEDSGDYDSMPELEDADESENVDNVMRILGNMWIMA
jgi:hypothetical protein